MAVAVVAGGTAGLGRAVVRALADDGWDVAVLARGEARLTATVEEVRSRGRRSLGVPTDVTDSAAVEAAADRIEAELGPIELWVNGPLAVVHAEFLDIDPEDFERITDVTYHGTVNGTRAALSRMVPRNRGHVIQTTSALSHRGMPLMAAYCAAKAAERIFSESVRSELLHSHSAVRISQVDMPALNTPLYSWMKTTLPHHSRPIPIVFQPEVGARIIARVAKHPRPRTWVGEPTVVAILGNRVAGGLLDHMASRFGYRLQQAPDAAEPMLPANLHAPVDAAVDAHGIFDDRSVRWSPQAWAVLHRGTANGLLALAGAAAGIALVGRRVRWRRA
ncbi:MAG: SDR family oxidoreductase [Actinomycetota bacterium]|nr:SDR family oxidoreductase [Actinomycetota bacterium]